MYFPLDVPLIFAPLNGFSICRFLLRSISSRVSSRYRRQGPEMTYFIKFLPRLSGEALLPFNKPARPVDPSHALPTNADSQRLESESPHAKKRNRATGSGSVPVAPSREILSRSANGGDGLLLSTRQRYGPPHARRAVVRYAPDRPRRCY